MYKVDKESKITYDSDKEAESVVSDSNLEFPSDTECCQRTENYVRSIAPLTSTPIKSQIVIVSSTEMPLSSDDSETNDVGSERVDNALNPWEGFKCGWIFNRNSWWFTSDRWFWFDSCRRRKSKRTSVHPTKQGWLQTSQSQIWFGLK